MGRHRSGELNRRMDSNSSRAASGVETAPAEASETFGSPLNAHSALGTQMTIVELKVFSGECIAPIPQSCLSDKFLGLVLLV